MLPIPPFRGTRNNHWNKFEWRKKTMDICDYTTYYQLWPFRDAGDLSGSPFSLVKIHWNAPNPWIQITPWIWWGGSKIEPAVFREFCVQSATQDLGYILNISARFASNKYTIHLYHKVVGHPDLNKEDVVALTEIWVQHILTKNIVLAILWMEQIRHCFISTLSCSLQGFTHPRWCRISFFLHYNIYPLYNHQ